MLSSVSQIECRVVELVLSPPPVGSFFFFFFFCLLMPLIAVFTMFWIESLAASACSFCVFLPENGKCHRARSVPEFEMFSLKKIVAAAVFAAACVATTTQAVAAPSTSNLPVGPSFSCLAACLPSALCCVVVVPGLPCLGSLLLPGVFVFYLSVCLCLPYESRVPDPDCLDVDYVALKGNYAECCSNGNYKKQEGRKEVCQQARKRRRQENL